MLPSDLLMTNSHSIMIIMMIMNDSCNVWLGLPSKRSPVVRNIVSAYYHPYHFS